MIVIASTLDLQPYIELFESAIYYNTSNIEDIKSTKSDYVLVTVMSLYEIARLRKNFTNVIHIEPPDSTIQNKETVIVPSREIEDIKSVIYLELLILRV